MEDNTTGNSRFKRIKERLKDRYRLVVFNDETHEEVDSYRLTLLNFYVFLSSLFVVASIIVILLVAFTPLKRLMPGYGDISQSSEFAELYRQVESLEKELISQRTYSKNVKKMLTGDPRNGEDVAAANEDNLQADANDTLVEPQSEVDEMMRREVYVEDITEKAVQRLDMSEQLKGIPLEQMYFSPPLNGPISTAFAPGKQHYGVDVLAPQNTPIKAVMDGFVFISDWTLETGNTIGIQHLNNTISFYKHNSALLKKVGSRVKAGEAVAIIGNTGTLSSGPHLHFELWQNGNPVNPTEYIDF